MRARHVLAEGMVAAAVALLVYGVSCLLCPPAGENAGFGIEWQLMSEKPFDLLGRFPHRLLAPFLAWLTGQGGADYVVFVRALHVVMIASVFLCARHLGTTRLDASLVAMAVGITAPVQMYKLHWVGYCDPLSYSLFFLAIICVRRTAVFWLLFLLNLFSHELAVFLLPWLWFLRWHEGVRLRADIPWVAGVLAIYAAYYLIVRANHSTQGDVFTYDYFTENPLLPWGALACWAMMLTHWLLAFGPVLAVIAWHQHRAEYGGERWQTWFVVLGIVAILSIAFDWMRHANLIVLPLVLASARYLVAGHRLGYLVLLGASAVFLLLHPPWSGVAEPTAGLFLEIHQLVIEPKPTDFSRVLSKWFPAVWPTLLWVYALLAAIWLTGWWLARPARAGTATTAGRGV